MPKKRLKMIQEFLKEAEKKANTAKSLDSKKLSLLPAQALRDPRRGRKRDRDRSFSTRAKSQLIRIASTLSKLCVSKF